jgi:hypothetical protein
MIFGLDISTSVIGAVKFDSCGKFIDSDYCDLRKVDGDLIDKAATADDWIKGMVNDAVAKRESIGYEHDFFIEDRLSGFGGGKTMQQTLLKLAAFNATVSYIVYRNFHDAGLGLTIEHIHPSTVKAFMKRFGLIVPKGSKEKKRLTLEWVQRKEPTFKVELNRKENPQPWCYDMADAYITAWAGFHMNKPKI